MSTDDRQRAGLFELLVPTVGREATVKLVEALPPAGEALATANQVAALEQRMDDKLSGLREELLAAFRAELVTAVSGQTRQVIMATATAVFGLGGLSFTLAQLL